MSQYETVDVSNINESPLSSPIFALTFAENYIFYWHKQMSVQLLRIFFLWKEQIKAKVRSVIISGAD